MHHPKRQRPNPIPSAYLATSGAMDVDKNDLGIGGGGFPEDFDAYDDTDSLDSSSGGPRYKKDAPVTEATFQDPPKQADVRCRCGSAAEAEKKNAPSCHECSCSRSGYPCSSSRCGCGGGGGGGEAAACRNPWNGLANSIFFGEKQDGKPRQPHPCFRSWLGRRGPRQGTLDLDYVFENLLGCGSLEDAAEGCAQLGAWKRSWERAAGKPEVQAKLKVELLRLAVVDGECDNYFFSFCQGSSIHAGQWWDERVRSFRHLHLLSPYPPSPPPLLSLPILSFDYVWLIRTYVASMALRYVRRVYGVERMAL